MTARDQSQLNLIRTPSVLWRNQDITSGALCLPTPALLFSCDMYITCCTETTPPIGADRKSCCWTASVGGDRYLTMDVCPEIGHRRLVHHAYSHVSAGHSPSEIMLGGQVPRAQRVS